jgi:hypothetical protein
MEGIILGIIYCTVTEFSLGAKENQTPPPSQDSQPPVLRF